MMTMKQFTIRTLAGIYCLSLQVNASSDIPFPKMDWIDTCRSLDIPSDSGWQQVPTDGRGNSRENFCESYQDLQYYPNGDDVVDVYDLKSLGGDYACRVACMGCIKHLGLADPDRDRKKDERHTKWLKEKEDERRGSKVQKMPLSKKLPKNQIDKLREHTIAKKYAMNNPMLDILPEKLTPQPAKPNENMLDLGVPGTRAMWEPSEMKKIIRVFQAVLPRLYSTDVKHYSQQQKLCKLLNTYSWFKKEAKKQYNSYGEEIEDDVAHEAFMDSDW